MVSPLCAFWQNPEGCHVPFTEEWPQSGHYHKDLIGGVLQRAAEMVVLLTVFNISTEELWSSVRVTIGFLVTSLTKALLPRLLSLAGRPSSRNSLGGSKLLPVKNDGGPLCSWGPSVLQTFFDILPQICASTQSCRGALPAIPSTPWLGCCSDMHCQLWDLI
jgi:hypothetical protein